MRITLVRSGRLMLQTVCAAAVLLYLGMSITHAVVRMRAADTMLNAADQLLASLTPQQKALASMRFDDARRTDWHFIPRERKGLQLKDLNAEQQQRVMALVQTIGSAGTHKVEMLLDLEDVLREMEGKNIPTLQAPDGRIYDLLRYRDLYNVTLYGQPSKKTPWGWSFEGHHISLNVTIVDGQIVSTPLFLGTAPAEVRAGPHKGLRPLAVEQDKAFELLGSLDDKQREVAIVSKVTHGDLITYNNQKADPLYPPRAGVVAVGLAVANMTAPQKAILKQLIDEYLARMPEEVAAARAQKLYASDFDKVFFAWTGGTVLGEKHYYRVQGNTFLIEFDSSQTPSATTYEVANHNHSVWRDFNGDFGADLLREHYTATAHQSPLLRDTALADTAF